MGNYNPMYKNKNGKSTKKINAENIAQQSVFVISCNQCKSILSERGCQIFLASDTNVAGYSTDTAPEAVEQSKQFQKCKECHCIITKASCKKCKVFCAIHSIYLCDYCQTQPTNGHNWIFLYALGVSTKKKWSELEPTKVIKTDFEELLKFIGVAPKTLQILKKEDITSAKQLHELSDQLLKEAGITLGEIAKLKSLK